MNLIEAYKSDDIFQSVQTSIYYKVRNKTLFFTHDLSSDYWELDDNEGIIELLSEDFIVAQEKKVEVTKGKLKKALFELLGAEIDDELTEQDKKELSLFFEQIGF